MRRRTTHEEEQVSCLHVRMENLFVAGWVATVAGGQGELAVMATGHCNTHTHRGHDVEHVSTVASKVWY